MLRTVPPVRVVIDFGTSTADRWIGTLREGAGPVRAFEGRLQLLRILESLIDRTDGDAPVEPTT